VVLRPEREHALLGAAGFLVAPRATEGGVEAVSVERLSQGFGLHHVGVGGGCEIEWVDAASQTLFVHVHDEVGVALGRDLVAKLVHFAEFPGRIDVQQRERQPRRPERLACQMQKHGRILAHRIEKNRLAELRGGFAQDVDRLRFQNVQVGQFGQGCFRRHLKGPNRRRPGGYAATRTPIARAAR
jgi:hypothetical protein